MPAQWSEKAVQERVKKANDEHISEIKEMFKKFRDGGWSVLKVNGISKEVVSDAWIGPYYFLVKMPGAAEMQINTMNQMRRLVRGV